MAFYDSFAKDYDTYFSTGKYNEENYHVAKMLPLPKGILLDIGSGTGLGLQMYKMIGLSIPSSRFIGVDPSIKMLEIHKEKFPDHKVECFTFEDYKTDIKFGTVISTFGSASYLDVKSIKKIYDLLDDDGSYFFMFCKDDYTPVTYSFCGKSCPFNTIKDYKAELEKYFPNSEYIIYDDYVIVRGKK